MFTIVTQLNPDVTQHWQAVAAFKPLAVDISKDLLCKNSLVDLSSASLDEKIKELIESYIIYDNPYSCQYSIYRGSDLLARIDKNYKIVEKNDISYYVEDQEKDVENLSLEICKDILANITNRAF